MTKLTDNPFVDQGGTPYKQGDLIRGALNAGDNFKGTILNKLDAKDEKNPHKQPALLVDCGEDGYIIFPVRQVNRA
ncbi:MAG: hypothetical protein IPN91_12600 [Holophagaceae bacterium]|uniref:Uncharacterized protein n=1 Tax=Candidatus Geothrix odensensis TaxID=2954440 RepID=A0A936F3H8_9BACT|nr:hypothetical protein [Candidatus Geothrix odensensis]